MTEHNGGGHEHRLRLRHVGEALTEVAFCTGCAWSIVSERMTLREVHQDFVADHHLTGVAV